LTAIFLLLEAKLSPIFEFIGKGLAEITIIFGDFFKELEDIGVLEFFFELLGDISNLVGKVLIVHFEKFKALLKIVTSFLAGFLKGLAGVEGLNDTWKAFLDTLGKVFDLTAKLYELVGEKLSPVFEVLGETIGKVVGGALKGLLTILTSVSGVIEKLINSAVTKLEGTEIKGKVTSVNDAIIKPDGSIIKTNPQDTIMALKQPNKALDKMNGSQKDISITDGGINIKVTEGNAKQAGTNFGEGLQEQMRQIILNQRTLSGERG